MADALWSMTKKLRLQSTPDLPVFRWSLTIEHRPSWFVENETALTLECGTSLLLSRNVSKASHTKEVIPAVPALQGCFRASATAAPIMSPLKFAAFNMPSGPTRNIAGIDST